MSQEFCRKFPPKEEKYCEIVRCKKSQRSTISTSYWLFHKGFGSFVCAMVGIVHRMSMTVIWMQMSLISALRLLFLDNNSSRLGAYWARLKLCRDNIAKNNSFTWPCQTNKQKIILILKSCSLRNFHYLIVKVGKKMPTGYLKKREKNDKFDILKRFTWL